MARHRAQAQFERARWRLWVLVPAWLLQLVFTIPMTGLFAWRLGDTLKHYDQRQRQGEQPVIETVWEAANAFLSFMTACCTIFEMVRYWGEVLTPWTMLFTHVMKTLCALAIVALDIVVLTQLNDRHYSLVSLGLGGALLLLVFAMLIWVVTVYRRVAIHGDYVRRTSNVKGFGFNDGLEPEYARSRASSLIDKGRHSFVSSRRVSIEAASTPPVNEMGPLQRTASYYNHQRDTQFDEYMARRSSCNVNADFEAAPGAEFSGAGKQHSPSARPHGEYIVLVSGTVKSNRPGQERSVSTTSSHVLVAVPEEAHEADEEGEEDHRALLRHKRRRSSTDLGGPVRQSVDVVPKWQQQQ
ncbi:hypothetical protein NLU13_8536 [Sarocladium strictum]|uniref:Uncharacterized protein n=1 Tax=Sarocladium strictum TaxID=5046 RepID=A0AA39GBX7_SARSR|nr:hypothetical protein NLU13_8536 [Sarocladium strictum]